MSPSPDAVTAWIERLESNDPHAASILWEQFASRLLAAAAAGIRLRGASRRQLSCSVPAVERRWKEIRLTWLTLEEETKERE